MTMPQKEEIEAIWERLKALEKKIAQVEQRQNESEVELTRRLCLGLATQTYNFWLTVTSLHKPAMTNTFGDYWQPREASLLETLQKIKSADKMWELVNQFHKDCVDFYLSLSTGK